VTPQQADKAAQDAVRDAVKAGANFAKVRLKNPSTINRAALQAIAAASSSLPGGAIILADSYTPDSKAVDVRITLDVNEAIESLQSGAIKTLNLAASTQSPAAKQAKTIFESWFSNDLQTVHFDRQGAWGQPVKVAVKFDSALDPANLFFYAYDKATNTYTRLQSPDAWVDAHGYVHFTTEIAGDIIISEGALARK
jgi:hypothetical protein